MYCDRHYTICNVHVSTATRVIAIFCFALQLLTTLKWITLYFLRSHHYAINTASWELFGYVFGLVITGLFLLGSLKKMHKLYWPFMIYNFLLLIAMPILLIGVVAKRALHQSTKQKNEHEESSEHMLFENYLHGGFLILFIISVILWTLFHGYLMSIIIRDYRLLKEKDQFDYYYREVYENPNENERRQNPDEDVKTLEMV